MVVHHFLIRGMTCLSYRDGFLVVSAIVYVITLDKTYGESWHKDINFHDSLNYYIVCTLNLERMLSLCQSQQEALTYRWDPKVVICPYGFDYY